MGILSCSGEADEPQGNQSGSGAGDSEASRKTPPSPHQVQQRNWNGDLELKEAASNQKSRCKFPLSMKRPRGRGKKGKQNDGILPFQQGTGHRIERQHQQSGKPLPTGVQSARREGQQPR